MNYARVTWLFLAAGITVAAQAIGAEDQNRSIVLDGVKNTRDLGGLTTTDGRTIRQGQLIRSGEIDHISSAGKLALDDLGVTTVIDLRTTKEATFAPATWPDGSGPRRQNIPLLENESAMIDDMRMRIKTGTAEANWMDQTFLNTFATIPADYSDELATVLTALRDQPEGEAIMFHCSGGKDRTGVITALLLTALGVPRDQIEADFLQSNIAIDADKAAMQLAAAINKEQDTEMSAQDVWPSLGVRPEYLALFYDTLEKQFGSVDAYLRTGLNLSEDDIDALQARYLQ